MTRTPIGLLPLAALALQGTLLAGHLNPGKDGVPAGEIDQELPPNAANGDDQLACDASGYTDPVELASGELKFGRTDLVLPGRLAPLAIRFQYRSQRIYDGHYGFGWFLELEHRLHRIAGPTDTYEWRAGTGEQLELVLDVATGVYAPPAGHHVAFTRHPDGSADIDVRDGTRYEFDALGLLERHVDRNGNAVVLTWATNGGGVISKFPIAGAGGGTAALDYRIARVDGDLGKGVAFEYFGAADGVKNGRLRRLVDDYGRTAEYDYDAEGNLIAATGPVTTYRDETGAMVTRGRTEYYTWSSGHGDARPGAPPDVRDHNLETVVDDLGRTVLVSVYDAGDRVVRQEHQGGTVRISYTTDAASQVVAAQEVDANGVLREYDFADGLLTRLTIHPIGVHAFSGKLVYDYEYDACCGQLVKMKYPRGNGVVFEYDDQGRMTRQRHKSAADAAPNANDVVHEYTYEPVFGQIRTYTDPLGNVTTWTYDYDEINAGQDLNGDGSLGPAAGNPIRVDFPDATLPDGALQTGIATLISYLPGGQPLAEVDPSGSLTLYSYYPPGHANEGLLFSVTRDALGLALTTATTYDAFDHPASVQDPDGVLTSFVHNALGELTEVQAPLGARVRLTYDGVGDAVLREVRNLDENGVPATPEWIATRFERDAWGRLLSRTEDVASGPGGVETRTHAFAYDGVGNLTRITTPGGRVEVRSYDERNLMWKRVRGFGAAEAISEQFHVDRNGNLEVFVDGNGEAWVSTYDLFDRKVLAEDPLGNRIANTFDARGDLVEQRFFEGGAVEVSRGLLERDELGRLVRSTEVDPLGLIASAERRFFHDAAGRVVRTVSAKGSETRWAYDTAGRLLSTEDAVGNRRLLERDGRGNVTRVTETDVVPGGPDEVYVTEYDYDALSRLRESRRIDRLDAMHVVRTTYEYDSRGNPVKIVDPQGSVSRVAYDLAGRAVQRTQDAGGLALVRSTVYDHDDLPVEVVDAEGRSTRYAFDAITRLTRVDYETGLFESTTYDGLDNVLLHRSEDGVVSTQAYDANGRMTSRQALSYREELTWTGQGRLATATAYRDGVPTSQVVHGYDGMGRLVSEDQDGFVVQTGYDADHLPSSSTFPSGRTLTMGHDAAGRLVSIADGPASLATYAWAGADRVASRTTNLTRDVGWDGLRRLSSISTGPAGSVLQLSYEYDDLDRRLYEQRGHDGDQGDVYGFDAAGRLADVWYDAPNPAGGLPAGAPDFRVTHRPEGARAQTQAGATTVSYGPADPLHRYTSVDGVARDHDPRGNLVDDGTRRYEYDPWNRLVRVVDATDGTELVRYEHDALGRRILRVEDGVSSRFVYSGYEVVAEYDISGPSAQLVAELTWGAALDELVAIDAGGQRYFVEQDALGSAVAITDAAGQLVERYDYDAFGEPAVTDAAGSPVVDGKGRPTSSVGNRVWFSGAVRDPAAGQYHMRARQYDPATGRFTSRDPLGYVDGLDAYAFAGNDPVDFRDPLGLERVDGAPEPGSTAGSGWLEAAGYVPLVGEAIDLFTAAGLIGTTTQAQRNAAMASFATGILLAPVNILRGVVSGGRFVGRWVGRQGGRLLQFTTERLGRTGSYLASVGRSGAAFVGAGLRGSAGFAFGLARGAGRLAHWGIGGAGGLFSSAARWGSGVVRRTVARLTGGRLGSAVGKECPGLDPASQARAAQRAGNFAEDDFRNIYLGDGAHVVRMEPYSQDFFATLDAIDPGALDGPTLSGLLQVRPYQGTTRPYAVIYEVVEGRPAAFGPISANSSLGPGGVDQVFIPGADEAIASGALKPIATVPIGGSNKPFLP